MTDPNEALLYGAASPEQTNFLNKTMRIGLDFVDGSSRKGKVLDYLSEDDLRRKIASALPRQGMSLNQLLGEMEHVVARYSVAQGDPRYLAFPDTGNSLAGLGADILTGFLNQNLIAFDRSAPSGTMIEFELIQWLRQLVGYKHKPIDESGLTLADLGGLWTSGGSMSNHIAVLTALYAKFPEVKRYGLQALGKRPVIMLAKGIEHFSFSSAALSLGLGQDSLVWCKSTAEYTSDPNALRETLAQLDDDLVPFMVVSVAGNCRTTSIDDIREMRKVCDEYGLWLHVDACHGGNLLFSDKMRNRLDGISDAQSVSLDPHKGLFVGYPCSYVLFKDPNVLEFICRYPNKFRDPACLDLGLVMPFYGSRGFNSLKLWLLIKHLGTDGIGELIERRQALNDRLVQRLRRCGWFKLLNEGSFYRTAFVFLPKKVEALLDQTGKLKSDPSSVCDLINNFTTQLSETLYKQADVIFDAFSLVDLGNTLGLGTQRKFTTMAMAVGHPDISRDTEDGIFAAIDRVAAPLAEKMATEALGSVPNTPAQAPTPSKGPAGW